MLNGIKVLDLSRVLAGPYCTQILGDLGADVWKLESPAGDETRAWGPPYLEGESTYFLSVNRNKRSLVVDLKHEGGAALVQELAERAANGVDILIVSSGAIAMGRNMLKLPRGALRLEESQAAAAVGQIALARA